MDDQKVGLGCGTLILIGLIVLIVGNSSSGKVLDRVEELQRETRQLSQSVERLHEELRDVKQLLEKR